MGAAGKAATIEGSPEEHQAPGLRQEHPVERVRALLPAIAAAAGQIDRERRIPAPLMAALHDARLFRLLLPASCGGDEADPSTFLQVLELISGADASVAWNLCQNTVCSTVAAYLPPATAREIWSDPRAILAWGPPAAECRAVPAPGGHRITGSWSFASGGRHATWLGAQCPLADAGGAVELRTFLVPAAAVRFTDTWDVIGLRGTASDSFAVQDLFVPAARSLVRDDRRARREPGRLYRMTTLSLFAAGFGSIALGVARTLLDAFLRLAQEKTPRAAGGLLRDDADVQGQVGRAEAEWRAARLLLHGTLAGVWDALGQAGADGLTMEQRIAVRMASTHAIHTARKAGRMAYESAGASAIFAANPFERPFRDLHTIAQQVQGRRAHFQSVGKFLLGLEPETAFL